jgi:hypothetical protein
MRRGRADRYDLVEARDLGQRGEPPKSRNIQTAMVAIADPAALPPPFDPKKPYKGPQRFVATANRRVDILEYERSHRRIGNEAYLEGRIVQAVFERQGLSGGSAWNSGSRIDAEVAKEIAIIRRLDTARAIDARLDELRDILGDIDAKILRQVLGENRSYAEVEHSGLLKAAAARGGAEDWAPLGKGGVAKPAKAEVRARRVTYIAQRFRDALETLARATRRKRT